MGARRHLEWGHEKYVMDTIQSHQQQVKLSEYLLFSILLDHFFPSLCAISLHF